MLATLNSSQIVDAIVKDTMKYNDPHDAVQISPDVVLASRSVSTAPALAPEITPRPEPKFAPEPKINLEPKIGPASEAQAAAPPVDTAVRVTSSDDHSRPKRSAAGRWLRGAFITFLFAGGSAAATIAWDKHGDTATQMLAEWTPSLASLLSSASQTTPVAPAQAAPPVAQDQSADQTATPPAAQTAAAAPAQADAAPSVESLTRGVAAMAQQIEQLKSSIAELKTAQEQMARELVKTPRPVVEAKPIVPRAQVSALPPRPPVAPVRKPKPITAPAYTQTYAPAPIAPLPLPSQAAAMQPPPAVAARAVADDDGPVVRPPMPVH